MNPQLNPYSPPHSPVSVPEPLAIVPAERWRRFWTYVIDSFTFFFVLSVVGGVVAAAGGEEAMRQLQGVPDFLITQALILACYVAFEGVLGRTPGKLLLGTKVVNEAGNPPSFGQVVGRALARMIPFEALAIFGDDLRTWHDTLARTYVVKCR